MNEIDISLIDWSRAQFALTAMYHWLFVPLTLGLSIIMSVMESIYYKTGNVFWKRTTQFWMKIFGINFAIGVATGIILEFEFGTNWSNYSWFVGDIFGAPLAIEGIMAFFLEATFIAVMYFGWEKVSKKFHLVSTWLVTIGATLSALWILVANAWMQFPTGMKFNPDTVRNEMFDFWAVIGSSVAINKFFHTIFSGWLLGAVFVLGISSWFLLRGREKKFALDSIKIAIYTGIISSLLLLYTGDGSAYQVAQKQPMKLAAMEGLYNGKENAQLIAIGVLNPKKSVANNEEETFLFKVEIPHLLSYLAHRDGNAFVPGIKDLIKGGYLTENGRALSVEEKMMKGKLAIQALGDYQKAKKKNDQEGVSQAKRVLEENFAHFGYGYFKDPKDAIPNIPLVFYSFHIMVIFGVFFIFLFILVWFLYYKKKLEHAKWMQWICLISIPLAYIASQAGWIVAEVGRQPWAIQDILPVSAAISDIETSSVKTTFFIFLFLFTALLIAEISIMIKQIKIGPEEYKETTNNKDHE